MFYYILGGEFMGVVQIIQQELDKRNIKPSRMMAELGFSNGLFSQWKSGKQNPSLKKIQKIAEYLNVSTEYLLEEKVNPNTITNSYNSNGNNSIQNIGSTSQFDNRDLALLKKIHMLDIDDFTEVVNIINQKLSAKLDE